MTKQQKTTRRKYIGAVVGGCVIGSAGCLSGGSNQIDSLPTPYLGDEEEENVVRVFEDLGCPACRTYQRTVFPQLEEDYIETNDIRYEHYDYVVPASRISNDLANVARGVQDRSGISAFWDFVETIFERQNELSQDFSVVREILSNLDIGDVDELLNSSRGGVYNPVINEDMDFGDNQYSVRGTPTVVVNDKPLGSGVVSNYSILESSIQSEFDI